MFQINSPGAVDGQFTEGNPQTGQRATVVSAAWLNMLQGEIVNVITHAGVDLDEESDTQLRDAITLLISAATGEGGGEEGAVPITREVTGGGLASGGGPLSADLVITVLAASGAETAAGAIATKAVTPLSLAQAAAASFGTAGYMKIPGTGMVICWGTGSAAGNSTTVITLPTTFPNACLFAGVEGGSADTDASHNGPYVSGRGVSAINVFNALNSSVPINFFAVGY